MLKVMFAIGVTIVLRLVEYQRLLGDGNRVRTIEPRFLFRVMNLYLPFGMVAFGLACQLASDSAHRASAPYEVTGALVAMFVGSVFRGLLCSGEPEVASWKDPVWIRGVTVPNTLSLATLCYFGLRVV